MVLLIFHSAGDLTMREIYKPLDSPLANANSFQYGRGNDPWKNRVPVSTDVLITHTPPKHHLDIELGCDGLLEEIWRVKPRLHVFGHIHSGHGCEHVWWDDGQAAYERLIGRDGGIVNDLIPSPAWIDAVRVIWYGVRGILWQYLMAGPRGGNGGILVNSALVYQSSLELRNRPEIVEL